MSKELKEINEALTNLWWSDHYQRLMERELAK
jgi:hypothetical protein